MRKCGRLAAHCCRKIVMCAHCAAVGRRELAGGAERIARSRMRASVLFLHLIAAILACCFVVVVVGCSHFQASRYHVVDEK